MSDLAMNTNRLLDLAGAICNKNVSEDDHVELDSILLTDQASRRRYLDYCRIHVALRLEFRACRATQKAQQRINVDSVVPMLREPDIAMVETSSPFLGYIGTAYHGTIGFFSQELPFSLLIAAVLTGLGLWFASMIYVSSPDKIAKDSSPPVQSSFDPTLKVVGKITGIADCKWADSNTETFRGANVLLGRKYALASGLMEITYDTGAKVILQGPVTYGVESKNGGFLSIGKLTGKVENETARGFSVHTPTATVTDLGTEFGVEVSELGVSDVIVFAGIVDLAKRTSGESIRLSAGGKSAARVDAGLKIVQILPPKQSQFVRSLPSQPRYVDRVLALRPAAYWNFDTDSGLVTKILDATGNGHDGEIRGNATVVAGGRHGNGLWLNGIDGFVEVPSHAELRPSRGSFSVAGWMLVTSQSGDHHLMGQAEVPKTSNDKTRSVIWSVRLFEGTGGVRAGMRSLDQSVDTFWTAPTGDLRDSHWHHLAVVFDRENQVQSYYVDGKPAATEDNKGKFSPNDSLDSSLTLKIGTDGGFGFTLGMIDDVVLFRRALTAEEVYELYR